MKDFNAALCEFYAHPGSEPTQQFFGIHTTNGGKVAIFAGGVPLTRYGVIVGGLGVSGGSGEQDQSVALAGQAAL